MMEVVQNNATDLLGRVVHEFGAMRPLLPTYLHLLVSAVFPIYTASHAALTRPSSAAPAKKRNKTKDDEPTDDDDEEEVEESSPQIETLQPSDAILFPVLAGCTLAGLYFLLKFFQDPAWLNWFLGIYFAGIGFFFMVRFLKDGLGLVRSVVFPRQYTHGGKVWEVSRSLDGYVVRDRSGQELTTSSPLPGLLWNLPVPGVVGKFIWSVRRTVSAKAQLDFRVYKLLHLESPVEVLDVVSVVLSVAIVWYHTFVDKPWFLTNLLGFSFCYGSLQFMTPGTSWTGTLLLSALFFYDIYFVFFTPMMVTVATKLDVPIKLLFPRPDGCVLPVGAEQGSEAMEKYLQCIAKKRTMAMLGLGDIVVPGMMLAFALRFDLYLFYLRKSKSDISTPNSVEASGELAKESADAAKPTYHSATGSWGERLWTNSNIASHIFSAKHFPKTYFHATIVGYVFGMIATVLVMQVAQHAQPALLYLVPGVLLSLWGTALVNGDFKTLWNYSEVPEELTGDKNKDKQAKANDKNEKDTKAEKGTKSGTEEAGNGKKNEDKVQDGKDGARKSECDKEKKEKHNANSRHLVYLAISLPGERRRQSQVQDKNDDANTSEKGEEAHKDKSD